MSRSHRPRRAAQEPPGAGPRSQPGTPTSTERVMVVARCGGHRCAALARRHAGSAEVVAAALRARRDGVLISTDCLGRCHAGAVAAVGWAHADGAHVRWERPPTLVDQVETEDAARSLATWLERGHDAPSTPGRPPAPE